MNNPEFGRWDRLADETRKKVLMALSSPTPSAVVYNRIIEAPVQCAKESVAENEKSGMIELCKELSVKVHTNPSDGIRNEVKKLRHSILKAKAGFINYVDSDPYA